MLPSDVYNERPLIITILKHMSEEIIQAPVTEMTAETTATEVVVEATPTEITETVAEVAVEAVPAPEVAA